MLLIVTQKLDKSQLGEKTMRNRVRWMRVFIVP